MSDNERRTEPFQVPPTPEPPGQTEKKYPVPPTILYDLKSNKDD